MHELGNGDEPAKAITIALLAVKQEHRNTVDLLSIGALL